MTIDAAPPAPDLSGASKEWRSALIDIGGSNRLLYFRPTAAVVDLTDAPRAALAKLLSGALIRLSELFTDQAALRAAQRACSALARKQRESQEEFGVSVAYLAAGLATWNPEGSPALSDATDEELGETSHARPRYTRPSSPVLLRPLSLTLRRGAQEAWELQLEEDFQLNGVLEHVLNADRQRLSDESITETDTGSFEDMTQMLDHVADACADVPEFDITPDLFLGAFSYLKQPMVADVDNLEALEGSDLVAALAGDQAAAARVRAYADDIEDSQPDYQPVDSEFLVLDADASQSFVVNAALSGRNMVVEGPPGTGKSQTIANVIASMVASGKRVLFVAQKRAAVEAVLGRLDAVDLGHLVLDLFAATGSRRFVSEALRTVIDRQKTASIPDAANLQFALSNARERLVQHRDALFDTQHGWGTSIAALRAESAGIPVGAQTTLRLPASTFATWSETSRARFGAELDELNTIGALYPAWSDDAGWNPTALTSSEIVADRTELASAIASQVAPTAISLLTDASSHVGASFTPNVTGAHQAISYLGEVETLASTANKLLNRSVTDADLEAMLIATSKDYRRTSQVKLRWGQRRDAAKTAASLTGARDRRLQHDLLTRARSVRAQWRGPNDIAPFNRLGDLKQVANALTEKSKVLQTAVHGIALADLVFGELIQVSNALAGSGNRLKMPRAHDLEASLTSAGLLPIITMIRAHYRAGLTLSVPPHQLLDWVAIKSLLADAEVRSPGLAGVTGDELNSARAAFVDVDVRHLKVNAARVRRIAAENLKRSLDANPEQHAILRTEITRKRNFRPVRRLFQEAPDVVLAAKPVWAMSPLQVSRLLPPEQVFDVVIFDEASQVKPADAIPALLRARQAIISGDSRQLPPTDFFTKVIEDDSPDVQDEPAALDAPQPDVHVTRRPRSSFTRDAESILFAMDRLLAGQSRRLLWHYRSRDERLIAVSNIGVYDGSLTTFPAADTADALRYISVPPSQGAGGGTNSPDLEVAEVVALVRAQLELHPEESVGVITFGVKHQIRIEAAIESEAAVDVKFRERLDAHQGEPFFIKSIERVQGDERDAIILTVGYGKQPDGKLRYFWGPLLQEGGERRLNVAISRARRRMTLVTSFTPDDVAADAHPSAGFRLMHRFLRFMASNGTDRNEGPDDSIALNPFEIDIRDRLTAAGLQLDTQVGVGNYRIDFAARHPNLPGRHVLAIEADGASYHSGHIARERDRLRQTMLEARGWAFHRIWSTDWFNNADLEVQKAAAAFAAAVSQHDEPKVDPIPAEAVLGDATPVRGLPRPAFSSGRPIDQYSPSTLTAIAKWLKSDHVIRTEDDELELMMSVLGFRRKGAKIEAALRRALRSQ
jgi:very-short-patch-repair endonuclease